MTTWQDHGRQANIFLAMATGPLFSKQLSSLFKGYQRHFHVFSQSFTYFHIQPELGDFQDLPTQLQNALKFLRKLPYFPQTLLKNVRPGTGCTVNQRQRQKKHQKTIRASSIFPESRRNSDFVRPFLPPPTKPTLVLDLDETLVRHWCVTSHHESHQPFDLTN